jgi:hypothetical protein
VNRIKIGESGGGVERGKVKGLVAKQAEAGFILPLREVVAHFARRRVCTKRYTIMGYGH